MKKLDIKKLIALIPKALIAQIKNYNQNENYGTQEDSSVHDTSVIHEICQKIDSFGGQNRASHFKLKSFVKLYEIIPDYSVLIYMRKNYNIYSHASKKFYWRKYRKWMGGNRIFSNPVKYSLECDWFTDRHSMIKAWNEITRSPLNKNRIVNILDCSSPVKTEIKDYFIRSINKEN